VLFYKKGCLFCHEINNQGGLKGPDLSDVALRLSTQDMTIRIVNGGTNMPAYGGILSKNELAAIVAFLNSRKYKK
jgi:ubiquinol-cytochrome c reductase cytochrome b subunit